MSFKATNYKVTPEFLKRRIGSGVYGVSKWIEFCQINLDKGRVVYLYEARQTFSKYVTVHGPFDLEYKVRFSNHRPIKAREATGDCDFFVGVNNFSTTTMEQALQAMEDYFNVGETGRAAGSRLGEA